MGWESMGATKKERERMVGEFYSYANVTRFFYDSF
jgi:hypothetical protein